MFFKKKFKLYRREGCSLFLKNSFLSNKYIKKIWSKSDDKKNNSFSISTHYSNQLKEKRRLKITYGISDKKYNNYYKISKKKKNYISFNILKLLESRLDNVVYRSAMAASRSEAKQMIRHKFIKLNNVISTFSSKLIKPGDYISINKKNFFRKEYFLNCVEKYFIPNWIFVNKLKFSSYFKKYPTIFDMQPYINLKYNFILGNCRK